MRRFFSCDKTNCNVKLYKYDKKGNDDDINYQAVISEKWKEFNNAKMAR